MNTFDYLHDGAPDIVERVRAIRLSNDLLNALCACALMLVLLLAAMMLEHHRLAQMATIERGAMLRADADRAALAATKIERTHVESLLDLDRRLRAIRRSGNLVSKRLAEIADRLPSHTWLTSILRTPNGVSIVGHAHGLATVSSAVAALMHSRLLGPPTLVRADADEGVVSPDSLAFELHLDEHVP